MGRKKLQPSEFMRLAEALLDDQSAGEVALRASVHASYYGVYHYLAEYFKLNASDYETAKHAEVRRILRQELAARHPRPIREAKRVFGQLFNLRVKADYRIKEQFAREDADLALEWAKAVFTA